MEYATMVKCKNCGGELFYLNDISQYAHCNLKACENNALLPISIIYQPTPIFTICANAEPNIILE